jgi:hypothetical protein
VQSDTVLIGPLRLSEWDADLAMRRHVPPHVLTLTVSPARFEQMVGFPEDSFLGRSWWNGLMDDRAAQGK